MKKRVVLVVLLQKNRFLLVQKALNDTYGGTWVFPYGGIKTKDETDIIAARRKLKETVGLDGTRFRQLYTIILGNYNTQVFLCDSWTGKLQPSCTNIIGASWFTMPELHTFNKSLSPFLNHILMSFTYLLQHYENHQDEWISPWEDV